MLLLRHSEAATLLTVSVDTVYRLVRSGKLRQCNPSPGCSRIARAEIDRYIAEISGSPAPVAPAPVVKTKLSRADARRMLR